MAIYDVVHGGWHGEEEVNGEESRWKDGVESKGESGSLQCGCKRKVDQNQWCWEKV